MPSTRTIEILPTAADLFHAAAEEFVRVGRQEIAARGRFAVALAGGSTPRSLYSLLASSYADFPWARTYFFFGDERHVPPTDRDSNYRMANESLLSKVAIPAENVFRVKAEAPDPAAAAAQYEIQLKKFFELEPNEFPRFDLILLGMGPDGHTASLFPDSEGLKERNKLVIANWVEKFKTHRISFTFPVLNNAAEVMFLVSGPDKADMVHRVLDGESDPPYPSQEIRPTNGAVLWILDESAARELSERRRDTAEKRA
ncbi:MAG: 6-phosphogluconolactonase [Terriglobales bacterium]|jgi:6-phosphogluconolactonase